MIATVFCLLACLAAGGAAWCTLTVRRFRTRHAELESSLAALRREMDMFAAMSTKADRHVMRVERDYSGIAERVGMLELRGEGRPYDQAIDSARHGADPANLARQFGLSSTEADLVTLLHGSRRRA